MAVEPQINIPLDVVPKFVDIWEGQSKHGGGMYTKVKIKGLYTLQGQPSFEDQAFFPPDVIGPLLELGVVKENGKDRYGHPAYKVQGSPTVTLTRREKAPYDVQAGDGNRQVKAVKSQAKSASPAPAVVAAATPAAGSGERGGFDQMVELYGRCADAVLDIWGDKNIDDPQVLVSATAALFIEANKRGISTAEQIRSAFDGDPGPQFPPD